MKTNEEMISYYFKEYQEQLAKGTRRIYKLSLDQFFERFRKPFDQVTTKDIRMWLAELDEKGQKPTTINFKLAALKSFSKFCFEEDFIPVNPAKIIKWAQIDDSLPNYLDKATLARLFEVASRSLLERAIVETLYSTGVRISELLNIREEDINWELRQIWIHEGKGDNDRFVLFTSECEVRLKEYLDQRTVKYPYIFANPKGIPYTSTTIRVWFRRYTDILQTPFHITPHLIRHTFSAHLAEKGMPIQFIQALLGHLSRNTTNIYTRLFTHARKIQFDSFQ